MMRAAASTGISRTSIKAACSNNKVKWLPSRAHGTVTRDRPCLRSPAWQLGGDVPVILEEIQMPPSNFGEVMRFAELAADQTGKQAAALGNDLQV